MILIVQTDEKEPTYSYGMPTRVFGKKRMGTDGSFQRRLRGQRASRGLAYIRNRSLRYAEHRLGK